MNKQSLVAFKQQVLHCVIQHIDSFFHTIFIIVRFYFVIFCFKDIFLEINFYENYLNISKF